jgi:hypothetical protein
MDPIRSGAFIVFDSMFERVLREQWQSEKLEPCIRMMLISAAMIYHEQGSYKLTLKRLLGNTKEEVARTDTPHAYGCAADISIIELIDPRVNDKHDFMMRKFPKAFWVEQRLNELFPFGDGPKNAAVYNIDHIHLECPPGGFKKTTYALSTWFESGAVGIIRTPQRRAS